MTYTKQVAAIKNIDEILAHRGAALDHFKTAMDYLIRANMAMRAAGYGQHAMTETFNRESFHQITMDGNASRLIDAYRKYSDRYLWQHLARVSGLSQIMDKTARDEWAKGLENNVPECTLANLTNTFQTIHDQRQLIFNRGLVKAFEKLSKRFKNNDAFKIGSKFIVTGAGSHYGGADYIVDVERVLYVLDGKPPPSHADSVDCKLRRGSCTFENDYFHLMVYKNNNGHVRLKRLDLINKANKIIAAYYGSAMADDSHRS